ncbi:MAG TPA: hypothetical protein VI032_20930 [Burkholderiaceae bacterium]
MQSQEITAPREKQQWAGLLARYNVLQLAAMDAWERLLGAYRATPEGLIDPPPELLERYQRASAMRQQAEVALFSYIQAGGRMSFD